MPNQLEIYTTFIVNTDLSSLDKDKNKIKKCYTE